MKKHIFTLLALVVLLSAVMPAPVQAFTYGTTIEKVSHAGNTVTIKGSNSCSGWITTTSTTITTTTALRREIRITVTGKPRDPRDCCDGVKSPFTFKVVPQLQRGVLYKLYVNGVYYFQVTKR